MLKHKNKIISAIIILVALAAAYFYGGNAHTDISPAPSAVPSPAVANVTAEPTPTPEAETTPASIKDALPEVTPSPSPTPQPAIADNTCILSVRCDTILNNMENLKENKRDFVPADGIIFPRQTVTFYEGESVFNVLLREMKKNKIHFEFVNTPAYSSAYVEGIGNLYEFDCGELSGWMYKVNGEYPNYGCSKHLLKPGDVIEWLYTCDLGKDIGGYNDLSGDKQ